MRVVGVGQRAAFLYSVVVTTRKVESFAPSRSRTPCCLPSQHTSALQQGGQPNASNVHVHCTYPSFDATPPKNIGVNSNNAYTSHRCATSLKMSASPIEALHSQSLQQTTPVGFEPTRGDPIGLAGRRLSHSAKVSLWHAKSW